MKTNLPIPSARLRAECVRWKARSSSLLSLAAVSLLFCAGCAATSNKMTCAPQPFAMNPYPAFSEQAEKIKYPPGAGTGAYWSDGRFNFTLNSFYDEAKPEAKCIFDEATCFRQEGEKVFAVSKSEYLVLDLKSGAFRKNADINAFGAEDQEVFRKLKTHAKGNVYFDKRTLMPRLNGSSTSA